MVALVFSRLTRAALSLGLFAAHRVASVALALTYPPLLLVPEGKARDVDLGDRNRDEILTFAPKHLALRNVAP